MVDEKREPKKAISRRRNYSLRLRLLSSIVGFSVLFWLISLAIMLCVVWEETSETFDDTLLKTGKMLIHAASQNSFDFSGVMKQSRENPEADEIHYQIIYQGDVISHSKGAPTTPFVVEEGERKRFENRIINGKKWRIYINGVKNMPMEVQVAQGLEMRLEIFEDFAEDLIIPGLIMLILLIAVSGLIIHYLLKPLTGLEQQLNRRTPKELTPISIKSNANELQAIESSLNQLLSQLSKTIENERRFTADAAHELRTPLAAISMQIQLLKRRYPTLADSLEKLRQDVDRSTNLVAHLLLLARLDPMERIEESQLSIEWIDPFKLLKEIQKRNIAEAEKAGVTIEIKEVEGEISLLYGNYELIDVMLQNLVRNGILYSPNQSIVRLSVEQRVGKSDGADSSLEMIETTFIIEDNGSGVSDEELKYLSQRFYRVLGTGRNGSGLGLSIVKRIVDLHGAKWIMESGSSYSGMRHRITFYSPTKLDRPEVNRDKL